VRDSVELGPDGVDHGVGRSALRGPSRGKGADEDLERLRLDRGRAQRHHLADLDVVE